MNKEAYELGARYALKEAGLLDIPRKLVNKVREGIEGAKHHWGELKKLDKEMRPGMKGVEEEIKELFSDPKMPWILRKMLVK